MLSDAAEHQDIHQGHGHATADNRYPAKRLHGRVHALDSCVVVRLPGTVHRWHRLYRHGIGHHILDDVAERR